MIRRLFCKKSLLYSIPTALCLLLSACGTQNNVSEIDVNDLSGLRIGVNLSYESDYIISERDDADVYRYDSSADMLMALNFGKVDAIVTDEQTFRAMCVNMSGVKRIEPAIAEVAYMVYFGPNEEALMKEFNAFLADFKQSEEYADYLARSEAFDGMDYIGPEIELTGTGREIVVAAAIDCFPRAYLEAGNPEPTGYDVEIIKRFTNARGYQIKWVPTSYEDMEAGVRTKKYDAGIGFVAECYREEAIASGFYPSDSFDSNPVYIDVKDGDIHITGELD